MQKPSPLLVAAVCGMCTALALAQEASPSDAPSVAMPGAEKKAEKTDEPKPASSRHATEKPAAKPTPKPESLVAMQAPTAEAVATPKPKKPGFFQRLFGSRKKKDTSAATPEPTASPTPAGRRTVRHTATPAPRPDDSTGSKPDKIAAGTPTPKAGKATPTPKSDTPKTAALTTPAPKAPSATPPKKATSTKPAAPEPPADADPEVKEKFRYEQAKAKAVEDPHVKSLKTKADDATTDEDSRKALRAYNKALFDKIRKIDSSVSDRADRMEAAIMKRLNE